MLQRIVLVLLAFVPLCHAEEQYSKTETRSWEFAAGGQVELCVRAGEVHIIPGG